MEWGEPEPEHRLAWRVPCLRPACLPARPRQDIDTPDKTTGVKYTGTPTHSDTHQTLNKQCHTHIIVGTHYCIHMTCDCGTEPTKRTEEGRERLLQDIRKFVPPRVSDTTARTEHRPLIFGSHAPMPVLSIPVESRYVDG